MLLFMVLGVAKVCPTYVGMNRYKGKQKFPPPRMPHVCGDEPGNPFPAFSTLEVCPTYVGMNRI